MASLIFSIKAGADLEDIADYIGADNKVAADKVVSDIEILCRLIASMPKMGRLRPDIALGDIRSFTYEKYIILYRASSNFVEIVRIAHGARDLPALLNDE